MDWMSKDELNELYELVYQPRRIEMSEPTNEATTAEHGMKAPVTAESLAEVAATVPSESDQRVVNNVMRHDYRVLSETEKVSMAVIKDLGLQFHQYLDTFPSSRELSLAKTKIEEAVMWAVKHITR